MKFKTQFNWKPKDGEVNDQPSKTVPNQAMSINEIFRRYAQGLPLGGGQRVVYYDETDDTPDLDSMELTDRMDYIQEIAEKLEDKDKKEAEKKRKAYEQSVIDAYEKSKAAVPAPPSGAGAA